MKRLNKLVLLAILALLTGSLAAGCTAAGNGVSGQESEHAFSMAPLSEMPADVQQSPVTVQQAYQFAVANPEVLQQLPCYCGCGAMGHASNYACYVSGVSADGQVEFDAHALGCSICVDITQDAMRLLDEGKTVPEIRTYVDSTYARYGPSNMP